MRLIDADKFKCILPCNKEFHHIINHARTVKAIPCKDIEKMRAEIEDIAFDWQEIDGEHESFMVVDLNDVLQIIDKYNSESEDKE